MKDTVELCAVMYTCDDSKRLSASTTSLMGSVARGVGD